MSTARKLLRDVSFPAERIENLSIDGNYESSALEANENNNKSETNQTNPSPALLLTNMAANVPFQNNNSKSFSKNFFLFFSFIMAQSMAAYVIGPIQLEKREGKREWKIYFRYQTISAQFWDKCAIMRPWWWFNVTCHCNFPAGVSKKHPSQSDATSCISIDN